ncbi:MAG: phosphatase PAP2 family protein [Mycobacterium sp.]|nr:phosphatase PAP2 family protein [Mycobacterium sp.]
MPSRMSLRHPALLAGAILAAAVFLFAMVGVLARWEWMEDADWAVLEPLYRYGVAHPGWVTAWDVLCTVFHPAVFRLVALIWIVYLLMGRRTDRYQVVLYLASTVEFSALIVMFTKAVVSRPRPDTALVAEHSSAFPSGHALGTAVAVTAMVFAASPWLRGRWRTVSIVIGVAIVVAVGAGRVVLNVHHPSDVLAGWALGYLWALVCLPVLTNRRLRAADETPATTDTGS